jgi:TRAP-type C4-dicarboxylate transport system permease small subunit
MMKSLENLIDIGEAVLATMAAIIMALIMLIVMTDVAMRYLSNSLLASRSI